MLLLLYMKSSSGFLKTIVYVCFLSEDKMNTGRWFFTPEVTYSYFDFKRGKDMEQKVGRECPWQELQLNWAQLDSQQ